VAPDLDVVTLPAHGRMADDETARIDIAVFSADLWSEGRGPAFMKVLLSAPKARWLHTFSAGLDDPVFDLFRDRGVLVTHSAGSSAIPIAHTVMMQVLSMCRNGRRWATAQTRHEWDAADIIDVEDRTMGVIGLGGIGTEVARLATHFGMRVIATRRTPTGDEPCETWTSDRMHELLPLVDDLVLCAPLTPQTRRMIAAPELALMRPGAHLVNVGRGELIDEEALVDALRTGRVGAAALDVFATEPLPADSPLWGMSNVLITPHSAGTSTLASDRAAAIFLDNLGRWVRHEPLRNLPA